MQGASGSGVAAVEFVASAKTSNTTTGATLVINKPTGTVQNDLMVALYVTNNGQELWTPDTGWQEIIDQNSPPGLSASYKVAGASEGSSYTFTNAANNRILTGVILTFRNAVYDTVGTISTTHTLGVQAAPAITLASNNSAIVAFYCRASGSLTWSNPTSGLVSADSDSDASAPSFAVYYQLNMSSGSTGTKSATISTSGSGMACILVGIKPA